jgi:hypothetical protein
MNANQPPACEPVADATGRSDPRMGTSLYPEDVLAHPILSADEKRAVLASWASDAHALENAPALRRLDNGAVVALDDILRALSELDQKAHPSEANSRSTPLARRKRLLRNLAILARRRSRDDDDDPPPCPAVIAPPPRLALAAA